MTTQKITSKPLMFNSENNRLKDGEAEAMDFLIHPPKRIVIKKKGLDAVDLIRKERD